MASLLVRLVASRLPHYHLAIRRNLLWVFAVFPLFAGVAAALLSYLPEWKPQANLWLADIIHWHHAYLFSPASWHGVFLLFCLIGLLALFAWRGWQGVSEVQRQQLLGLLSECNKDGLAELDSPVPMAFVAGLWRLITRRSFALILEARPILLEALPPESVRKSGGLLVFMNRLIFVAAIRWPSSPSPC